jgi:hypothetical protein
MANRDVRELARRSKIAPISLIGLNVLHREGKADKTIAEF